MRLYGLRNWVEQGYKQVKDELGWADFQVRSDRAIRRHWALVCCAFSFCWWAFLAEHPDPTGTVRPPGRARRPRGGHSRPGIQAPNRPCALAGGAASGAGLADPLERAAALLAVVVASAAAPAAATAA